MEYTDGKMKDPLSNLKWNNHKDTFFETLKILREKSNYSDATLAVEGNFYPVHKLVMSTCSEYFSDIFERTTCKSPVIVLKDVRSHEIEALLDYMYLGEVNINQNDLASLLKTAEGLRIKGLTIPDEDLIDSQNDSISSDDEVLLDSPPPKRRRQHDSNKTTPRTVSPVPSPPPSTNASVSPTSITSIPLNSISDTFDTEQDQPPFVKVEMVDVDEPVERLIRENHYEGDTSSDCNPPGDDVLIISKTEYKVEVDEAREEDENFRRKKSSEEGGSNECDPGGDYSSYISKIVNVSDTFGNTPFPGPSQQDLLSGSLTVEKLSTMVTSNEIYATHTHKEQHRWGRLLSRDGYLLMQDFRNNKPRTGTIVYNLSDVTKHLSSPLHVYLGFGINGMLLGRVIIRVNEEAPRRSQQLINLCLGQTGSRYSGSTWITVDCRQKQDESLLINSYITTNNGNSNENLFPDLEKTGRIAHKQGLVVILSQDHAAFRILTKSGEIGTTWPGPALGEVVSGLNVLEKIVCNNLVNSKVDSKVTISESGLVIDSNLPKKIK